MRKLSAVEQDLFNRYAASAQDNTELAANLRLAAGALRYVIDTKDEASLAAIGQYAGVDELSLDLLVGSAAAVEATAEHEQGLAAAYNERNSSLLQHGLTERPD